MRHPFRLIASTAAALLLACGGNSTPSQTGNVTIRLNPASSLLAPGLITSVEVTSEKDGTPQLLTLDANDPTLYAGTIVLPVGMQMVTLTAYTMDVSTGKTAIGRGTAAVNISSEPSYLFATILDIRTP